MDNLSTTRTNTVDLQCTAVSAQVAAAADNTADPKTRKPRSNGKSSAGWPQLATLGLSDRERRARLQGIGGSDANIILSGDATSIRELWLAKRGEASAADLSDNLAVMLGCWTEAFNRQWYERLTGEHVTCAGKSYASQRHSWRRCTVDGFIEAPAAVWEAKHTSAFAKPEEVMERYMPQLQHNMAVVGVDRAILSVIFGNHKFELFEIAADWLYQIELLEAEQRFYDSVRNGTEPIAAEPPPPPRAIGTREVCLDGNNAWASAAVDWVEHRQAAKSYAAACQSIKSLVENDVSRAFGHGVEARRSKSGAISIHELAR